MFPFIRKLLISMTVLLITCLLWKGAALFLPSVVTLVDCVEMALSLMEKNPLSIEGGVGPSQLPDLNLPARRLSSKNDTAESPSEVLRISARFSYLANKSYEILTRRCSEAEGQLALGLGSKLQLP